MFYEKDTENADARLDELSYKEDERFCSLTHIVRGIAYAGIALTGRLDKIIELMEKEK